MTIKEEVERLKKEISQLKQDLKEQNNRWKEIICDYSLHNKFLAVASVVSALAAVLNLLIAWLNYRK